MAKLNLVYYNGQDSYSDGDIEEKMLKMAKDKVSIENLNLKDLEFPIIYHFSHIRENILNWYPFDNKSSVLEIGSGCGAITGLLCERTKNVVSVELSKRRALINYYRHENFNNLEIIVGNFNDIKFTKKFDYIILNGVFEYAINFTDSNNPYVDFLKDISSYLDETGKILISIENRLGLKYFSGASEDHTGNFFLGLNDYDNNNNVRTFSKSELINILNDSGLSNYKFYYPYPDYKFPNEIYTEEAFRKNEYGKPYYSLNSKRLVLFNEYRVIKSLANEGVLDHFSNSFFIEASKFNNSFSNIIYAKINSDRKDEYRIATIISNEDNLKKVIKKPLDAKATNHIYNMYLNTKRFSGENFTALYGDYNDKSKEITYPYLQEDTLNTLIKVYIEAGNKSKIIENMELVFDTFFHNNEVRNDYCNDRFKEIFGTKQIFINLPCVKLPNIDLICDNIYYKDDKFTVIDCEWIFDIYIPNQFIMWRTINELYSKNPDLSRLINKDTMLSTFDINNELSNVFREWAIYFAETYVLSNSLECAAKKDVFISMDDIYDKLEQESYLTSKIYYSQGDGFSEDNVLFSKSELNNNKFNLEFSFDGLKNIDQLRWDPIESKPCICQIKKIESDIDLKLEPINAFKCYDKGDVFLTMDPMYSIEGINNALKYIRIQGEIQYLRIEEILDLHFEEVDKICSELNVVEKSCENLEKLIKQRNNECENMSSIILDKNIKIDEMEHKLQIIYNSKSWHLIRLFAKFKERMYILFNKN